MNERTQFFIKYISHNLFSKGLMLVVCERLVGDGHRLLHIDLSSSDHRSTYFSSWLGLLNVGSLRAQRHQSASGSYFGILSPTDSNRFKPYVPWFYYCLTSTCFRCSSAYLHRSISWLTTQSRINMLHFNNFRRLKNTFFFPNIELFQNIFLCVA